MESLLHEVVWATPPMPCRLVHTSTPHDHPHVWAAPYSSPPLHHCTLWQEGKKKAKEGTNRTWRGKRRDVCAQKVALPLEKRRDRGKGEGGSQNSNSIFWALRGSVTLSSPFFVFHTQRKEEEVVVAEEEGGRKNHLACEWMEARRREKSPPPPCRTVFSPSSPAS